MGRNGTVPLLPDVVLVALRHHHVPGVVAAHIETRDDPPRQRRCPTRPGSLGRKSRQRTHLVGKTLLRTRLRENESQIQMLDLVAQITYKI